MKRNMGGLLKISVNSAVAFCLFLTVFGFYSLHSSPYTGLRFSYTNGRSYVQDVDPRSPASLAGLQPGDSVVQIDNRIIPSLAFSREPSEIERIIDWRIYWEATRELEQTIIKGRRVEISFERNGIPLTVFITPGDFPLAKVFSRTILLFLIGWICLSIGYLVIRKKTADAAIVYFIACSVGGAGGIAFAPYLARDISFGFTAYKFLSFINQAGGIVSLFGFTHLVLIFPRRKKIIDTHPNFIWILYGIMVLIPCAVFLELASPSLAGAIPLAAFEIFIIVTILHDFSREKNIIRRKQIQWVVLGFSSAAAASLVLYALPLLLGLPPVPEDIVVIPAFMAPLSLAFAITRYRLMDIDTIFDQAVIYGFTILILEGIEFAFLGSLSHFYEIPPQRIPYLLFFAVLLIVFLYAPIRNRVKESVERIFKRGSYNIEEELQKFALNAGQFDGSSPLDKFESCVNNLLGPSGLYFVHIGANGIPGIADTNLQSAVLFASDQLAKSGCFEKNRGSCFGYQFADRHVSQAETVVDARLESTLFVPFFVEGKLSHIAVLQPKSNETAYSKKDQALLDALSASVSHMLQAEEKRLLLEKERIRLAREIHDGISSEFTGIISHADKAGQHASSNNGEIEISTLMEKIKSSSRRGVQELRNIVWAMSPERQSIGFLGAYIKRFSADLLGSMGIRTEMTRDLQDEEKMIDPQALLSVFRTAQEACHNIVKHSGADFVRIALRSEGEWLEFSIEDNGKGFEPAIAGGGLGLQNMKRRAEETGGEFNIISSAGSGVLLKAKFRVSDQYPNSGVLK